MASTKPIVDLKGLWFRYNEQSEWVLRDVDFSVNQGEWVAVVGHNGSGKSTLAKCLNGILLPEVGTVKINGYNTLNEDHIWEIRQWVGMVFQNPDNQFVGTTVQDDVAFGMENHGLPREEMVKRLEQSLTRVHMLDYINQEPHRLSGGQKQRVAIAGIVALEPEIIVLDEATSMLDPQGRHDILELMKQLNKELGITVISITHDLEETLHADRMLVMNDGEPLMQGQPADIFQDPERLTQIGLDLPLAIKLRQALSQRGVPIKETVIEQDDLVESLWTLYSKM
ncbi:energy-coupling factor ABC transporter ATP-binding protein [Tuberibacillus sp. Marseille-P3662]|uniref:energy-coupling factor ABC transporter ATP-binding protein n=1 Tax=Tuberibacillus sp. Marseille-P3662 TaxID=1965358 RepID=UPI000A1CAC0B|nr:energy-coupling factor ABC transporter ATP-binding protein [Tuberibacillus sp. Marseille-P3662]